LQQYSPTDYAWRGASNDGISATLVVTENQRISSSFAIDAYTYSIHPLSDRLHVVVEQDPNIFIQGGKCGTAKVNSETIVTSPEISCNGQNISVLFTFVDITMLPPITAQFVKEEIMIKGFDELVKIGQNSQLPGSFVLAHPDPINLRSLSGLGGAVPASLGEVTAIPTQSKYAAIRELRNKYKADIVVVYLRPFNFSETGAATEINASAENSYVGVIIQAQQNQYPDLVAHEIGHLLGGKHLPPQNQIVNSPIPVLVADPNNTNGVQCVNPSSDGNTAQGSFFRTPDNKVYSTVMIPGGGNVNCRNLVSSTLYPAFGDADVFFNGVPTGALPDRSPGTAIRGNFNRFAVFRDSYSVQITGPNSLSIGERGTWIIQIKNCEGQEPPQVEVFMSSEQNNKSFDIVSPLTKTSSGYEMRISATMLSNDKYINVYARFASGKAVPFALGYPNYAFLQVKCSDCPAMAANAAIAFRAMPKNQQSNAILQQNSPNPVLGSTEIRYSLLEASDVALIVEDNLGREVARLVKERQGKGTYTVPFDVRSLPSGIYTYRLQTDSQVLSKQMFIVK
jgi:hypothetical protein